MLSTVDLAVRIKGRNLAQPQSPVLFIIQKAWKRKGTFNIYTK